MTQIVLQPSADATARAHYADTISHPVVLSHVYSLLSTPMIEHLWNFDGNGMTWEYMYALDEVRDLNIPYLDFNNAVGYAPNYVIQGFSVLDETKSEAFLDAFDLRAQRIEWPPDPEEVAIAIREFEELDRRFQAVQRLEQGALR